MQSRGAAMAGFDKQRFVTFLRANVSPQEFGEGRCAKFVRLALADAGLVPASHPVSAKDWGPTLVSLGFAELAAGDTAYQLGDVAVIQGTSESKDGHIQGYDSAARQWISDFVQKRDFWPGPSFRNEKPAVVVYRRPD
jgi:hypothetical protein